MAIDTIFLDRSNRQRIDLAKCAVLLVVTGHTSLREYADFSSFIFMSIMAGVTRQRRRHSETFACAQQSILIGMNIDILWVGWHRIHYKKI